MKLHLAVLVALSAPASAQWSGNGPVWTNDRVGIETNYPSAPLNVHGESNSYAAIQIDQAFAGSVGLRSWATGVDGRGVIGTAWATSGEYSIGVDGQSYSTQGYGLKGSALASSGENYGVYGATNSSSGYSGYFAGGDFHVTTNFAGINRKHQITSAEVFGVTAKTNSWGGMYMQTWTGGKPFYGYATDNTVRAYHYFDVGSNQWRLFVGGTRMAVNGQNGFVGIGTLAPSYKLHVNGDAGKPGGGSWSNASDVRLKRNVEDLDGALEKLLALRGVTYEYKDPAAIHELAGTQTGVVAQEVEEVFPEWVAEGADGFKRVTFRGFEALTVEALRELRVEHAARVDDLRRENEELRAALDELRAVVEALANED